MDEWEAWNVERRWSGWSGGLGGVSRQELNKCERGLFWLSENPLCLMTVGEQECGCGARGVRRAARRCRMGSPGCLAVAWLATLKDHSEEGDVKVNTQGLHR